MATQVHSVVLFSRPGCHLCDEARRVIATVRAHHPFSFEEVDIETEDGLIRDYGFRVPVVVVDGGATFEIEVPASALAALVRG